MGAEQQVVGMAGSKSTPQCKNDHALSTVHPLQSTSSLPCWACLWLPAAASPATTAAERSLSPCPCVWPWRRGLPADGPPPPLPRSA